ncbi:hypothetical protein [Candidatus Blastococcus massiliensis]|uniref:hypothetical protein n=1 Tax=Candidatus Blastococcus massiliensis TaxID=1470358 RepID=UPI0004B5FCF6|nr:hypothetical protein [Candidatus Blastococcus massiliensis]
MTDDMTIDIDGEQYVLRRDGDGLQVGQRVDENVTWLDTVDGSLLPESARTALESGNTSDEALRTAVRGVVEAQVNRGG